jgi:hypothetical protein
VYRKQGPWYLVIFIVGQAAAGFGVRYFEDNLREETDKERISLFESAVTY